jgi:hypothetical protein
MALNTPCDFAKIRYLDLLRLRMIWSYLLVILGVDVVIFLTFSILFFLRSHWLPGALGTLGTIFTGSAGWLADDPEERHAGRGISGIQRSGANVWSSGRARSSTACCSGGCASNR